MYSILIEVIWNRNISKHQQNGDSTGECIESEWQTNLENFIRDSIQQEDVHGKIAVVSSLMFFPVFLLEYHAPQWCFVLDNNGFEIWMQIILLLVKLSSISSAGYCFQSTVLKLESKLIKSVFSLRSVWWFASPISWKFSSDLSCYKSCF